MKAETVGGAAVWSCFRDREQQTGHARRPWKILDERRENTERDKNIVEILLHHIFPSFCPCDCAQGVDLHLCIFPSGITLHIPLKPAELKKENAKNFLHTLCCTLPLFYVACCIYLIKASRQHQMFYSSELHAHSYMLLFTEDRAKKKKAKAK